MSRLPSLQNVLNATLKTILRFPLETIISLSGTIIAIVLNEKEYNDPNKELYEKALLSCSLCLVLFLSVSLFFLASKKSNIIRFFTSILLGGFMVLFVFNFHKYITEVEIQQFIVLNIALHLLVSFAGFLPRRYNQDEFWEFNKQLFLRILTAGLYSIVLYCGLALAILAVDKLFKVEFYDHIYFHVFYVIAGLFNTIFFLNGVPETNSSENPLVLKYPKGLKNFTQYVLLPLISLYLVILICYEAKILITLSLPVGWVSYLVLVFAIFGILSFLLVHPIATETGNLWMRTFSRWFYFLLIPLLGLLFWAIIYRINLYGFTHERYYVLLLSIWLSLVVVYFLIQKQPKIKFIPISMCLAGLLSIVGPQGANSISKNSQLYRFEKYMQQSNPKKVTFEQEKDLSSIVSFLEDNYGIEIMVPYAKTKLEALLKKHKSPTDYEIMEALGYEYKSSYEKEEKNKDDFYYYYYENRQNTVENIHGYDVSFNLSSYDDVFECTDCIKIDNKSYSIQSTSANYGLNLRINQDNIPIPINDFVNKQSNFEGNYNSNKKITQEVETPKYKIQITYLSANGKIKNNKRVLNSYNLKVLVKIKN
ncbi:uncharacterized protein DUF4153 [Flavobacterium araucananum]|uniref:DUF4153 domain-containing protein n=1 Tax=Flavobacterium araucananum TaxID=946678 RepID=A0A227PKH2_9FLAO|nr:DUF4153 domain-containing protein [Flavobacterium araucananum]OXG09545.1 DUF4153 domain-containing protein [Flavobacterium araucananum]PWK02942.1 uncharacterized protein DUF4153 [Flavobacterium araucananum]